MSVPEFGFYNMDCIEGLKHFPDKYFDLAIVDPPYGIGQDGGRNKTRTRLAPQQNINHLPGVTKSHQTNISLTNCSECPKTKSFGVQITLSAGFVRIQVVGLFGIKIIADVLRIANLRGLPSVLRLGNSNSGGMECCRKI